MTGEKRIRESFVKSLSTKREGGNAQIWIIRDGALQQRLVAMELNVRHGFVSCNAMLYVPQLLGSPYPTTGLTSAGLISVKDLMALANNTLARNPVTIASSAIRTYQDAIKTGLDRANNNLNFVF